MRVVEVQTYNGWTRMVSSIVEFGIDSGGVLTLHDKDGDMVAAYGPKMWNRVRYA